jgi:large subunit ribosomal protein L23
MMDPYSIIRKPMLTEKCHDLKEKYNQVAFQIDRRANKVQVKEAVEKIFKVKVKRVNVMNMAGKKKRLGRNMGKRSDWRKAVVTLMPGETIDIIEGAL